jgi:Flp pilus assembly protein TadG
MRVRPLRGARRWGAAAVETGLVLLPMTIFLCGLFEYSRLIMDWNVLNNAAREGCRYALVNNTSSTVSTDVTTIVTNFMGNETANFTGFTVTVSGTHQGTATAVNNLVAGDLITVKVTGQYQFLKIIPVVPIPASLTITSAVTMVCEGAT